jgi:hypothetical protein
VSGFYGRFWWWLGGRLRFTLRSNQRARREQRGAVWLETLVLSALMIVIGVTLQGFGSTLAESLACAGSRIRSWSENGGLGVQACADGQAATTAALAAPGERGGPITTVSHEDARGVVADQASGQDKPTAEQLFRTWQRRWHERHNAAVKRERAVREQLRADGLIEFVNNWSLFQDGKRDALGKEYEGAARELEITSSMLRAEFDVFNRLEDRVDTLGQRLTPDDIDGMAAEIANGLAWFDFIVSSLPMGGAGARARGGARAPELDPGRRHAALAPSEATPAPSAGQAVPPLAPGGATATPPSPAAADRTPSGRLALGGAKPGPALPNRYNPCGLKDNCGYSVISFALEYQAPGKFRNANELYTQQRHLFGLTKGENLPKTLTFPGRTAQEVADLENVRPPAYKALFDSNNTLADYTINNVAEMNGLSVRPARHALDEWRRAFRPKQEGGFASLDESVDAFRAEALERLGARVPSTHMLRDRIAKLREKLPGLYIIGSRSRSHFMTLRIHDDGQIIGFDPQNGAKYRNLEEVRATMGGDPDLILFVPPPTGR